MHNFSLWDLQDFQVSLEENKDTAMRQLLGVPGYAAGFLLGFLAATVILSARSLFQSYQTTWEIIRFGWHVADESAPEDLEQIEEKRSFILKYVLGFPGVVVGAIAFFPVAAVSVLKRNSIEGWQSGTILIIKASNVFLPDDRQLTVPEDNRPWHQYLLGSLGLVIATPVSLVITASIYSVRMLTNSYKNMLEMTLFSWSMAQIEAMESPVEARLMTQKWGYGFLGFVLGAGLFLPVASLSALWRSSIESLRTAGFQMLHAVNVFLPSDEMIEIENDKRPWTHAYVIGLPGVVVALPFSMVVMTTVYSARMLSNSFKNALEISLLAWNMAQLKPVESILEERTMAQKWFYGFLGYALGAVVFLPVVSLSLLWRSGFESWQSGKRQVKQAANVCLPDDLALEIEGDERHWVNKYLFGLPGVVIALPFSVGAIAGIGGTRVMTNSFKNSLEMALIAWNTMQLEAEVSPVEERPMVQKWGYGFLGYALGTVMFLPVVSFSAVWRSALESWQTGEGQILRAAHVFLPDDQKEQIPADERPWTHKYVIGLPGVVVTLPFSLVAMTLIYSARMFTNSSKNMLEMAIVAWNTMQRKVAKSPVEYRPMSQKWGYGFLGYALGTGLFLPVVSLSAVWRSATESWRSGAHQILKAANVFLPVAQHIHISTDRRSWVQKYLMGLPGLVVGLPVSALVMASIYSARMLSNSLKNMLDMALIGWNTLALSPVESPLKSRSNTQKWGYGFLGYILGLLPLVFAVGASLVARSVSESVPSFVSLYSTILRPFTKENVDADERHWSRRYVLGFPGVMAGAVVGSLMFSAQVVYLIGKESLYSFAALSGTQLNYACNDYPLIPLTVEHDKRSAFSKFTGLLGYVGAVLLTTPLASAILAARYVPMMLVLVMGILISPVVAAIKGVSLAWWTPPRFTSEDNVPQALKNLYSSLSFAGDLPRNVDEIANHASGGKGGYTFLRKVLTFNAPSFAEELLECTYEAYKQDKSKPWEECVEGAKCKIFKQRCTFFDTDFHRNLRENQINEVANVMTAVLNPVKQ